MSIKCEKFKGAGKEEGWQGNWHLLTSVTSDLACKTILQPGIISYPFYRWWNGGSWKLLSYINNHNRENTFSILKYYFLCLNIQINLSLISKVALRTLEHNSIMSHVYSIMKSMNVTPLHQTTHSVLFWLWGLTLSIPSGCKSLFHWVTGKLQDRAFWFLKRLKEDNAHTHQPSHNAYWYSSVLA